VLGIYSTVYSAAARPIELNANVLTDAVHGAGPGAPPQGRVDGRDVVQVVDGRVTAIRSIVNPDKLGHLGAVESLREVLDGSS
jgi:hypothetical protein